jgi:16S rRNA (cytidine1402-2'-O)-methyltransferase
VPVPGVSAVTAALSVTPLRDGRFFFYGYLPSRQGERQRALAALRSFSGGSLVFFESPRRLEKALHDILEILGDRQIVMAREMTKIHEEFLRGSVREVLGAIRGKAVKGEVTLIIGSGEGSGSGAAGAEKLVREESIQEHFERIRIAGGLSDKEAMRQVARERGISRRDVYRALLEQKSDLHKQD